MKKLIYSALAVSFLFISCTNSEDASTSSLTTTESSSVISYVSESYPEASIVSASVTSSGISVTLSTSEKLSLSRSGSLLSYSSNVASGIAADSLHTDSLIVDKHGKKHHGHAGETHGSAHHKHLNDSIKNHTDNTIDIDSLPTTITNYIAGNYSGYTVLHAQKDTICSGNVTAVMVCDSVSEPIKLVFGSTGSFLMSGKRMDTSALPAAVSSALSTSFADYKIRKRCSLYTLADGSVEYKVYLFTKKIRKIVFISNDGSVVCEL